MIMRKSISGSIEDRRLRAIDLYSGVGGWSLGLSMAGIDVVASYEWWNKASLTNHRNNGHLAVPGDIRELKLEDLPTDIDIVVGSPPCTQFSFANRGGNGDIEDGLRDIAKFLEIVDFLKPKYWAMENVPRVAGIFEERMAIGGSLERFRHLEHQISIVDMAEWGLPQRRKRCIIGNINHELLLSYRYQLKPRTLGDVVDALAAAKVRDPIYEVAVRAKLKDHEIEQALSPEEVRINRESKAFHPIYNNMEFPDLLGRPGRTITATCTRVSRESIVIDSPDEPGKYRRLSVRERASLQGFPITYQFYGESYAQKLKMIGNAIPPLFTFYIGQAILSIQPQNLASPKEGYKTFSPPSELPALTLPDTAGELYPPTRKFRSAIPQLRFKSGVRFDLSNRVTDHETEWSVGFYFGNSKDIQAIPLDRALLEELLSCESIDAGAIRPHLESLEFDLLQTNSADVQSVWSRRAEGTGPFALVDKLGEVVTEIIEILSRDEFMSIKLITDLFHAKGKPPGTEKLIRNATNVLAGLIVGSAANEVFRSDLFNRRRAKFQKAN